MVETVFVTDAPAAPRPQPDNGLQVTQGADSVSWSGVGAPGAPDLCRWAFTSWCPMTLSAFAAKELPPEPGQVLRTLGDSATVWELLISHIHSSYPPVSQSWTFAGAKYGWSLRLKRKDRVILYLTPQEGCFQLGVALGEQAVRSAHEAVLPAHILALLDAAPRYPEGRGIRLSIRSPDDLATAETLAAIKMGALKTLPGA